MLHRPESAHNDHIALAVARLGRASEFNAPCFVPPPTFPSPPFASTPLETFLYLSFPLLLLSASSCMMSLCLNDIHPSASKVSRRYIPLGEFLAFFSTSINFSAHKYMRPISPRQLTAIPGGLLVFLSKCINLYAPNFTPYQLTAASTTWY